MRKAYAWTKSVLKDAITRAVAIYLAGAITALVALVLSPRAAQFLLQTVQVPLILLLIVSAFSLIALALAADMIILGVRARKSATRIAPFRDEPLENATSELLAHLARVEAGIEFDDESREARFVATPLTLFDAWETSLRPSLRADELAQVQALRDRMSNQSMENARDKSGDWVRAVKDTTQAARSRIRGSGPRTSDAA